MLLQDTGTLIRRYCSDVRGRTRLVHRQTYVPFRAAEHCPSVPVSVHFVAGWGGRSRSGPAECGNSRHIPSNVFLRKFPNEGRTATEPVVKTKKRCGARVPRSGTMASGTNVRLPARADAFAEKDRGIVPRPRTPKCQGTRPHWNYWRSNGDWFAGPEGGEGYDDGECGGRGFITTIFCFRILFVSAPTLLFLSKLRDKWSITK